MFSLRGLKTLGRCVVIFTTDFPFASLNTKSLLKKVLLLKEKLCFQWDLGLRWVDMSKGTFSDVVVAPMNVITRKNGEMEGPTADRYPRSIIITSRKHAYIIFDLLKPHFYTVKLGFTGVYIIFLISAQKHRLWVLVRTASPRRF